MKGRKVLFKNAERHSLKPCGQRGNGFGSCEILDERKNSTPKWLKSISRNRCVGLPRFTK